MASYERRLPVYLLLDCSESMAGEAIQDCDVTTIASIAMQAATAISDSQLRQDLPSWEATLDDVLRDMRTS